MRVNFAIISLLAIVFSGCTNTNPSTATASNVAATPATAAVGDVQKVKGLKDIEGEIIGKPVASSKFNKLKIGMSMKQVTDLIGQPTDQGSYVNGKAFIPFYFGNDSSRTELVYKSLGRLTFAQGIGDTSGSLIKITHDAKEDGYR
jgi:hypothetical protein